MKRFVLRIFITSLIISGAIINLPSFALTFESTQDVSFTLNPTIRVTLSNNNMRINDLAPGNSNDSNIIKVTAESNAIAGYTLSSTVGNSTTYNTTNMTHTNGTSTFTNLNSNKASLSNFNDSTWGYSYATCATVECTNTPSWISGDITGTTSPGYNGLPLYNTENPTKLINATAPGSSAVKFKFGAKASSSQIAGTYSNVINFIGVGKIITTTYTINFNDPSSEATSGTLPSTQTGTSTTGAVEISSTQPQRDNYIFKGWCTEPTSDDTCSGETVQPGGMLALHPGTSNLTPTVTRTLYAMWGDNTSPPGHCTDKSTCMQTMTMDHCTTTSTTVTDARDGQQYNVTKIGDACWMTTNLNLAGGTALSAEDTDVTSAYISSFTTSNNLTKEGDTIVLPSSGNNESGQDTGINIDPSIIDPIEPVNDDDASVINTNNDTCGSQGPCYSYYSWGAATLASGKNNTTANTDAEQSICPKGWHLPNTRRGTDSTTDIKRLMIALGSSAENEDHGADVSNQLQASPNNFELSGMYARNYFGDGGVVGYYWSATFHSDSSAYGMHLISSSVSSATMDFKTSELSVRCVLNN